jgi:hypothetical protein
MMQVDLSEALDVFKAVRQPVFAVAAQIDWDIPGVVPNHSWFLNV